MWDNSLADFADDVESEVVEFAVDVAADMHEAVVQLAPVDTSRFVSNTNVAAGDKDLSFDENKMIGRMGALSEGKGVLTRIDRKKLVDIHITNTTPYGGDLEEGTSPQARNGVFNVAFLGVAQKYK